ncbi:MAG TPA: DMT family transporter, partial [Tepidisphaeraceae bacterium]|nr:DMT family transporter [Tepidisphaeraceae bacterium]
RMADVVKSPLLAATVALLLGSVALGLVTATGWLGRGNLGQVVRVPWWVWVAGAMSLFTVVSILALPKVGAEVVVAGTMFGQLTAGALLDHFGWLGVPQVPMNAWRIAGAVVLLAGVWLMQHK